MERLLPLLLLAACGTPSGTTTAHVASGDTDADTDSDTDTDTATDTGNDVDYLEVAAIGFEYRGGWNEETQELENYLYTDSEGNPQPSGPYVLVTLATTDYFSMSSTDNGFEDEYCEFIAGFYYAPTETLPGMEFDWDKGKGGTGNELETYGAFEGYLAIDEASYSPRCTELDPAVFSGGDPLEVMDGMHFGVGFGPLSDHLYEFYKDGDSFADYEDAMMSQYIAMNHPDGTGGYTFDAYDWNGAYLIDTDYDVCVPVDDGAGGTFDVCGQYGVDADGYYVPGDATTGPRHGFVTGFSAWLEDTPNLDLSILLDGT